MAETTTDKPLFSTPTRDLRLDFLRGVALMLVLVDHVEDHSGVRWLRYYTLAANGLSDAAELFVFLSGFVFGRAYNRRLDEEGFLACQRKAIRRALTVYLAFLVTTFTSIAIGICFGGIAPVLIQELRLDEGTLKWILWSLPMYYQVYGLDVLAFYAIVTPCAPAMLLGLRRTPVLAWVVVLNLYLGAQLFPEFQLPSHRVGLGWFFNPFAWQFLFFIGLYFGALRSRRSCSQVSWMTLSIIAIGLLLFSLLIRRNSLSAIPWSITIDHRLVSGIMTWSNKNSLGPFRLLHFMALAFIGSQLLPVPGAACWRSLVAAPFINCGQHSLAVYSFGTILMFLSCPVFSLLGTSPSVVVMVIGDYVLLSVLFANGLRRWPTKGKNGNGNGVGSVSELQRETPCSQ
ncbi:MAG: OpgC domain-containing protein [Planctomycetota bacterium]